MGKQRFEKLTDEQKKTIDVVADRIESTLEQLSDFGAKKLAERLAVFTGKFKVSVFKILHIKNPDDGDLVDEICLILEKDEQVRTGVLIKLNRKGLLNRKKKKEALMKDELERMEFARKAHSYLREVFAVITFEQRWEFVNGITFFEEQTDLEAIENLLKEADGVEESRKQGIIGCLLDDESRTELIKIMVEEGLV